MSASGEHEAMGFLVDEGSSSTDEEDNFVMSPSQNYQNQLPVHSVGAAINQNHAVNGLLRQNGHLIRPGQIIRTPSGMLLRATTPGCSWVPHTSNPMELQQIRTANSVPISRPQQSAALRAYYQQQQQALRRPLMNPQPGPSNAVATSSCSLQNEYIDGNGNSRISPHLYPERTRPLILSRPPTASQLARMRGGLLPPGSLAISTRPQALPSSSTLSPSASSIIRPSIFSPTSQQPPEMRQIAHRMGHIINNTGNPHQGGDDLLKQLKRDGVFDGDYEPPRKKSAIDTEDKDGDEFICPLCFDHFDDPHIINCGHTYCNECIQRFLINSKKCPECSVEVKPEFIIPNRKLRTMMLHNKSETKRIGTEILAASSPGPDDKAKILDKLDIYSFFRKKYSDLNLGEVELLMTMLSKKKEVLVTESEECRSSLIIDFLEQLEKTKEAEIQALQDDLKLIRSDLELSRTRRKDELKKTEEKSIDSPLGSPPAHDTSLTNGTELIPMASFRPPSPIPDNMGIFKFPTENVDSRPSVAQRKLKIHHHFSQLAESYLRVCKAKIKREFRTNEPSDLESRIEDAKDSAGVHLPTEKQDLEEFTDTLVKISRYTGFRVLATLSYTSETMLNPSIVTTIEFDKDRDFFAIAGVTRKIKLFEYASVIASAVNIQCPNGEIQCNAKISCLGYSNFYKNKLGSSDYDGKVHLWDASTCSQISMYSEHEKRVWSIDFSDADPRFLVSGSDDCRVKLWTVSQPNSVMTLQAAANICCVKFVPESSFNVAFGSADHCVHYYDLRQPKQALHVYQGHKKAVSYVKFTSKNELISASTDSSLKMWDLDRRELVRTYEGHVNDKNFVGMATDGDYLVTGSETNSIHIYYKYLQAPILRYKFENYRSMILPSRQEESSCEFVSAVGWRTGSPVVIAANSQGIVKVLELV